MKQTLKPCPFRFFFSFSLRTFPSSLIALQSSSQSTLLPFFPRTLQTFSLRALPFFLAIAFAFLSLSAVAQENYKEGYIVGSNRDTVRGQIDFRDWMVNPAKISFLNSRTGKPEAHQPEDLSSFSVNGEIYRSFKVHIDPFSLDPVRNLADDWNGGAYDSTIFLRLIVGGKMNLYYYEDSRDLTYFFVQGQGGMPELLRIRNQVVEQDGQRIVATDKLYRRQLATWVADCNKMAERLGNLAYTESALRKLVFGYNNCGRDTTEQRAPEASYHGSHHGSISFFPLLGYMHSSFRLNGDMFLPPTNWPSYNGLAGGLGMQLLLPRERGQFAFITDLLFNHFSLRSANSYPVNNFDAQYEVLDFNMLKLDIQFRYLYPAGDVRPFLNVGFSNSLTINNKSYQSYDNVRQPPFGQSGAMASYQVGFIGGAGVQAGRWTVEARFERTAGLVNLSTDSSPITSLYLLAGFRL